jgi:hypothetical protein
MSNELPIPPAALTDDRARELVRVWASGGSQHVSLATGLWSDPAACGIMLVDLARHLARAYEQSGSRDLTPETSPRLIAVHKAERRLTRIPDPGNCAGRSDEAGSCPCLVRSPQDAATWSRADAANARASGYRTPHSSSTRARCCRAGWLMAFRPGSLMGIAWGERGLSLG